VGLGSDCELRSHRFNEEPLAEGTFAGAPAQTFSDGYDPDYASYLEFDLVGTDPPASRVPLP